MNTQDVALVLSALGGGAVIQSVVNALKDRRKLGADTTSILTSAARELVEPLRKELATERAERADEHRTHLAELEDERRKAESVRRELDRALEDCRLLRRELQQTKGELDRLRARLDPS